VTAWKRRRLKIIPNAFAERAVLKLMFGALIRAAERWRSVKVEFERRQLAAVQKELKAKPSEERMMLQSDYPEILELDLGLPNGNLIFILFCWGKTHGFQLASHDCSSPNAL
jgi:hypothetical protein